MHGLVAELVFLYFGDVHERVLPADDVVFGLNAWQFFHLLRRLTRIDGTFFDSFDDLACVFDRFVFILAGKTFGRLDIGSMNRLID